MNDILAEPHFKVQPREDLLMRKTVSIIFSMLLIISILSGCAGDCRSEDAAVVSPGETPVGSSQTPASESNNETAASPEAGVSSEEPEAGAQIDSGVPAVYFTSEISPESLVAIYSALGAEPFGNIAIKVHTGEPPGSNYLRPELIGDLVRLIGGTIVETNAVGGRRASNAMHMQVAKDHGFLDLAPFDLLDADGEISLPIIGGEVLSEVLVGANFPNYDYYVVLSHFKGHASAGYGGAIKNLAIGLASAPGKSLIHSGGTRRTGYSGNQENFLKGMAEASMAIVDHLNGNLLYINVMNRLSVDCDCMGNPAEPDMHDIGILASFDPVALDQACVDLIYLASDGDSLIRRIESRNGIHTLEHAGAIGLGSREYVLVSLDD